jgi:hypothetical protein
MSKIPTLVAFLLVSQCHVLAQWSMDPTVNTYVGKGSQPKMASDDSGGVIITSLRVSSAIPVDTARVYAQRISRAGVLMWRPDGVLICPSSIEQFNQQIVGDGFGGAIIAWQDRRGDRFDHIYAQRISAEGVLTWRLDGVPICLANGYQQYPQLVGDGAGGAFIVWEDYRNFWRLARIFCQHIDAAGQVLWPKDGIPLSVNDGLYNPQITTDMAGGAIVTWHQDMGSYPQYYDILVQRVTAKGDLLWRSDGTDICQANEGQFRPQITSDGLGGAIVVWEDERYEIIFEDIFAQRVDSSGNVLWQKNGVAASTAKYDQVSPQLIADCTGGAIIAWNDCRDVKGFSRDEERIYVQRIDAAGSTRWATNGLAIFIAPGGQQDVQMTADGSGGAIIVWDDTRSGIMGDIYAQRIDTSGVMRWAFDAAAISTAIGDQEFPQIVSDGAGGAIVSWEDNYRSSPKLTIFAQHVNEKGTLTAIRQTAAEIPVDILLMQNYPNPFNPRTRIDFTIAQLCYVSLNVFDMLGRRVASLVGQQLHPGAYSAQWDATGIASGVYTYQLVVGSNVQTRKCILLK